MARPRDVDPLGINGVLKETIEVEVGAGRSEEHTSELQSLVTHVCRLLLEQKNTRLNSHALISYAVFCLKKKTPTISVY